MYLIMGIEPMIWPKPVYGSIMHFNLRTRSQADPLPLFKAIADGAWGETNVTCDNGNRSQDWTFVPSGYEITMDEVE